MNGAVENYLLFKCSVFVNWQKIKVKYSFLTPVILRKLFVMLETWRIGESIEIFYLCKNYSNTSTSELY